ncbi:MAG: hypothetical protein N2504_05225 [candidate division WOR-3 bacterium]|nr:hypothetical protein [candidate division WOR-3 bacterium]MCX7947972.1 hypothetical protein [candidate division WOR-3 bacterium]MDW8150916.1 hypothetical protein [candidate division WOR-3 bacterium]
MKYINIYLSTTPEERGDKPPRYLINYKNLIKEYEEYKKELEEIAEIIKNTNYIESETGLPVYSIAIFYNVSNKELKIKGFPFKLPNKIVVSRNPYDKYLNYLESEFGNNLIVSYSKKEFKSYIISSNKFQAISEDLDYIKPHFESGVYRTSMREGRQVLRTIGGQNIDSVINEEEKRLSRYIADRIEEIVSKFQIDRLFISSPDEKSKNIVSDYLSKRTKGIFKGFISLNNSSKNELLNKLLEKLSEIDIEEEKGVFEEFREKAGYNLAVVGLENVIKHALMHNIRTLIINPNFSHEGYVCHSNGVFYHKELDFPCDDIEKVKDIVDYIVDAVIESQGKIEVAHTQELNELIAYQVGAILRFKV